MKQAVYYLYEYEENKQMRNVGFVKCQHKGQQAIFQIHGKGLVCNQGERYEMNLFSGENDRCYISRAGHVETEISKINYMVTVDEVEETIFGDYDGLYIHGNGNTRYVAMWNTKKVTFDQVQSYKKVGNEIVEEAEENEMLEEQDAVVNQDSGIHIIRNGAEHQKDGNSTYEREEEETAEEPYDVTRVEKEETLCEDEVKGLDCPIEAEECCYDAIRRRKEQEQEESHRVTPHKKVPHEEESQREGHITYEKIERQDIAKLPQREWRLANNSFLLHGYHNYQHLLFIQEAGRSFVGVPGVFSPREADAAKGFGFPVFHRIEPGVIDWDVEECDLQADFGYWCKEVTYRTNR